MTTPTLTDMPTRGLLRTPRQTRTVHRVHRILDAAHHLHTTGGLNHVTTTAVAEHADVSIGSLYQFFADRDAILTALADRDRATLALDLFTAGLPAETVDHLLDTDPITALTLTRALNHRAA